MDKHDDYEAAHCSSTVARLTGLLGLCLVGFLLSVPLSLAQSGQGTVTGTVTDLTQAIVPKANVTLTNVATGVTTKGQSSELGIFYFGAVPIGEYKIVVEKQGFDVWAGSFTLFVGQNAVVNPTLRVGSAKTVVEVTGAATLIETQSGAVADVKESNQIRDLPLNGRQIGGLFNLTAGVEGGAGGARVNGMKVGALDINMDGASMVDRFRGGMALQAPGIETVEEFRIETVGSSARFDQPATVIMASRSGTNQLHGAAYEYLRDNTVIGATRLRTDPIGPNFHLPLLIRNEFGGFLSGPVDIPHVYKGKDKAFWFFDYEGLRSRGRAGSNISDVPTAAMWQGDLSNAYDPRYGGDPIIIYDPKTTKSTAPFARTPFPNNHIPTPFGVTAMALKALTALPSNSNNPYIAQNFTSTYPNIQSSGTITAKWDQNISDKDRLSVRYTRASTHVAQEGGYYADPIDPLSGLGTSASDYQTTNVAVNYNRTISPNWLNELLVGVLREPDHHGTNADFTDWADKLGVPNPFSALGWPSLYVKTNSPSIYMDWDSDNKKQQHMTSETIEDNATWTHGKHTVQFGFRGRREQNNIEELAQAQGSATFGPAWTTLYSPSSQSATFDTGDGFAELLLGLPDYLYAQYNRGFYYFRQTQLGLYANDKIKLGRRLTLNLGLRWDYFTPYSEARNRIALPYAPDQVYGVLTTGNVKMEQIGGIPPTMLAAYANSGLTWQTANSIGYPSSLFKQIHHDFGPRLGVAYQLNHNTVIRGSYGIFYVPEPLNLLLQSMRKTPPLNLKFITNPTLNANVSGGVSGSYYGLYPYMMAPASTDYLPPITVNVAGTQTVPAEGNSGETWDGRNWNDSRDQTWNITIEHELPKHTGLRLSYIGTYGGNLEQQYAVNDAEPNYNYTRRTGLLPPSDTNLLRGIKNWSFYAVNHSGYSRDHSFQAELHRTFGNGVAFQAFYTFTRAKTTQDPSGGGLPSNSINGDTAGGGANVPQSNEVIGEPTLTYAQRLRLTYFNYTSIPPHRVTFNGIYALPFGKGKHFARNASTPLNYLIGGWQIATIGGWNSGYWMSLSSSLVQPGSVRIPASQRATLNISGSNDRYRQWFAGTYAGSGATNVSGTLVAPVARLAGPNCSGAYNGNLAVTLANGNCYNAAFSAVYNPAPRTNIIGPGAWNDDLSLYKHFTIGEKVDLRFAADAFNSLNHPTDNGPSSTTGLQDLAGQSNGPRQIQLSLRLSF
jgi:hypothetical protein